MRERDDTAHANIYSGEKMFATFDTGDLGRFTQRLDDLLTEQRRRIDAISCSDEDGYPDTMGKLQEMQNELSIFFTPLSHLNSVCNSDDTREAYESSLPLLSRFHSETAQNEKLYKKLKRIVTDDPLRRRVVENEIREFRLSGAELSEKDKKRIEEIDAKLSEKSALFSQNLLDATAKWEMVVDREDVAGMPEDLVSEARFVENGEEKFRFTLQIPSYIAYITYGPNRELREKIYRAYSTRAPENGKLIEEILSLRHEKALMLGYENYAGYALETRDAESPSQVVSFLEKLADSSKPIALKEFSQLKKFAESLDGIEELESYDIAYYSEKLKKSLYGFDDETTRPYFESTRVLEGLLSIVSGLFGVDFSRVEDIALWHESALCYDIFSEGSICGRIYFDLYARPEKRGGAWMHDWETYHIDTSGKKHLPSAFVTTNFPSPSGERPSLLRHDDVVTLFHEMGHALHHLFSTVSEYSLSGINGVAWDAVEFPSQFLENFAYEKEILGRFAFHYRTGEKMPEELILKIKSSKNFHSALGLLRQVEFSLFDMLIHTSLYDEDGVAKVLEEVRRKIAVITPPSYNRFQNGFSHIFSGGYAAGYYSYKWAEVLSADAFFECLDENGNFDTQKALGYRKYILERGGSEDMSILYREWLGREPSTDSLLKLYDIHENGEMDES